MRNRIDEWWCDYSLEEAKKNYLETTGVTEEEEFDGQEPDELNEEELNKMIYNDSEGSEVIQRTFKEELARRTEPDFFATTEY